MKPLKKTIAQLLPIFFFNCMLSNSFAQTPIPGNGAGSGNALDFNGTSNYVSLPVMTSINNLSQLTVECWINCNSVVTGVPFAHWVNHCGIAPGPSVGFMIILSGGEIFLATNSGMGPITNNVNLQPNQWHHIACIFDGTQAGNLSKLQVYVNGVQKNLVINNQSVAIPANIGNLSNTTWIGARGGCSNAVVNFLDGKEDEVRVWDVALTQTQIRDNMCKKLVGNETGLIGYWRFDEGTGTTAFDSQTNVPVNDGTLQ